MALPQELWELRKLVPVPERSQLDAFIRRMWEREAGIREQVSLDLSSGTGPGTTTSRLLYAMLALHKCQSRVRALEAEVERLESELDVERRVGLTTPEVFEWTK